MAFTRVNIIFTLRIIFMYHSPDLRHFSVFCIVCSQIQYSRASAQIPTYGCEGVFQLLNPHGQELTLDDDVEIRNQSALEELMNLSLSLRRGPWRF
jgi:hypothetical protein